MRGLEVDEILMIGVNDRRVRGANNKVSPFSSTKDDREEFAIVCHVISLGW